MHKEEVNIVLLRLINNDRVIGQMIYNDRDHMAIYAPMAIEVDETGETDYIMYPYDPLSDTVMGIFGHDNVLTLTIPKKEVIDIYDEYVNQFYPTLEEMKKKMLEEENANRKQEAVFDSERLKEMFQSFLDGSAPIDKKKLN